MLWFDASSHFLCCRSEIIPIVQHDWLHPPGITWLWSRTKIQSNDMGSSNKETNMWSVVLSHCNCNDIDLKNTPFPTQKKCDLEHGRDFPVILAYNLHIRSWQQMVSYLIENDFYWSASHHPLPLNDNRQRHSDQWVLLTNELEADVESLVGGGGGGLDQTILNRNSAITSLLLLLLLSYLSLSLLLLLLLLSLWW